MRSGATVLPRVLRLEPPVVGRVFVRVLRVGRGTQGPLLCLWMWQFFTPGDGQNGERKVSLWCV